jgi:hypothetical protein
MTEKTVLEAVESKIRPKNQVTIPPQICDVLRASPGDFLRWELRNGILVVCKSVTRRVSNNTTKE